MLYWQTYFIMSFSKKQSHHIYFVYHHETFHGNTGENWENFSLVVTGHKMPSSSLWKAVFWAYPPLITMVGRTVVIAHYEPQGGTCGHSLVKEEDVDGHQTLTWDARRHSFCGPRPGYVQLCPSCVWSQQLMEYLASRRLPEGDRTPHTQPREIIIRVDFDGLVIQFWGDYPHSLSDLNKLFGSPS